MTTEPTQASSETPTNEENVPWAKDPRRVLLKEDVQNKDITDDMKPAQAMKVRKEYEKMGLKLFSSRLRGMRNIVLAEAWQKDPLRNLLEMEIKIEDIPEDMNASEAMLLHKEYKEMGIKLFTSRLNEARKKIATEERKAKEKAEKEDKWTEKNPTRRQMKFDVAKEIIKPKMKDKTAQSLRAIYQAMDPDKFASRLKSMRDIVARGKARAAVDSAHLAEDRKKHPRPKTNHRGEPSG